LYLRLDLEKKELKLGKKSEVFGSIGVKDIEKELAKLGFVNLKANLEKPLKELGEKRIDIDLGEGVKAKISVEIAKDEKK